MAMPQSATEWTVEMVNALPEDGQRHEVIDGELLVSPSPTLRHQFAASELFALLREYLKPLRLGLALCGPLDITYSRITNVQPDVLVLPLVDSRRPRSWAEAGRLLLAVEVLSPSTARTDRQVKRRLYQREGVPEYWIVDIDARIIERWRPADPRPEMLADSLVWQPEGANEPLEISLPEFFGMVAG